MTTATLTATYSGAAAAALDLLRIEQQDWSVYTGKVSKQEVVRWVAAAISEEAYELAVDCGIAGESLVCVLYAYPLVADLDYRLLTSYGTLSERAVALIEISEQVQFRLTDSAATEFPARSILSVEWTVECLNADGEVVAPPALSVVGTDIVSAATVYGTATVRYLCERHSYVLNAPRRTDALDNNFSAVVAGVYQGGLAHLVIEMPPSIDVFEADADADCGWSTVGAITAPDDELPVVQPQSANKTTTVDYCSQIIVDEVVL